MLVALFRKSYPRSQCLDQLWRIHTHDHDKVMSDTQFNLMLTRFETTYPEGIKIRISLVEWGLKLYVREAIQGNSISNDWYKDKVFRNLLNIVKASGGNYKLIVFCAFMAAVKGRAKYRKQFSRVAHAHAQLKR